ncbi:ABC transporter ATP-binding protein [Microbacterium saperdae]|uniref:Peptide/nickel transport system ATP-binding protein n=1 Tax=Microbacterium saperdae TaxID=69368 RepID=A0A543BLD3_9MICO|nr:dipeptide/oligopeptide/nickel ABC transporter ATP-binding protein [Microbacterium saperdae]TQL85603.1 peptide/nickel transport system ATP-binding protein [Microbacterium saperdae]GGM62356.1 hypothetical protein GCM10010489_37350 [Microbacterium saperdae]
MNERLLRVDGVSKRFGNHQALSDVSFSLDPGATLGVVGESGSGKSTLGRIVLGLISPTSGLVSLDHASFADRNRSQRRAFRRAVQLIPQDPRNALNPTMTIEQNLFFHLRAQGAPRSSWRERALESLDLVGLPAAALAVYPHEISGGQAQRVAIARAISNDPRLIVCDEAVSALDKSVQAQVLNTLSAMQASKTVAMLFISHDLAVVEHMSDEVLVLKDGVVVESGRVADVMRSPQDAYTRDLIAASTKSHAPQEL